MRLFIADDSEIVTRKLSVILSDIDHVEIVGHARTVQDAISAIKQLKPDLTILDLRMPGGSGIDVLESIKQEDDLNPVVIVLTNYPFPQYEQRCMNAGADFFFDKSTELDLALEVIRKLAALTDQGLNGRPSLQEKKV